MLSIVQVLVVSSLLRTSLAPRVNLLKRCLGGGLDISEPCYEVTSTSETTEGTQEASEDDGPEQNGATLYTCLDSLPILNKCLKIQLFNHLFGKDITSAIDNAQRTGMFWIYVQSLPRTERVFFLNVIYFLRWIFELNGQQSNPEFSKVLDFFTGYSPATELQDSNVREKMFPQFSKFCLNKSENGQFLERIYLHDSAMRGTLFWIIRKFDLNDIDSMIRVLIPKEVPDLRVSDPEME
ncbi:hypothetical protein RF11_00390 [Thelohanellus kitauei]|uniref:Uncharacterized protein n=1 Tax=Thelohanellus kitauei TaxID=669202 RepID=A0A0C2J704_THEKT|nr:hypothetical protein RF11_00390 [Thelohanellus kitauei]